MTTDWPSAIWVMLATAGAYWLCWALRNATIAGRPADRGGANFSAAQRHVRTRAGRRIIERYQVKWH